MSSIVKVKDNIGTTFFKQSPVQYKDLKKGEPTFTAKAGELYIAIAVDRGSSDPNSSNYYGGDHWKIKFKDFLKPLEGGESLQSWLVFQGDVEEYQLVP